MIISKKLIIPAAFLLCPGLALAQRDTSLTREVEVVKSFKPSILDANKINDMPGMDVSEPRKPSFSYSIESRPVLNAFSVGTLKAAAIADAPKTNPGYGLIRAGVGNYNKPYAELFFNNLNTKKSLIGLHASHLSSHGKINLAGGDHVKAPFSKNEAEFYMHQYFRKSVFSVNAHVNHDGFAYYGYPEKAIPAFLNKENQAVNYQGKKQTFTKTGVNISLSNPSAEMDDANFSFNALYDFFQTKTGQQENFGELTFNLQKPLYTGTGLLQAGFSFNDAKDSLVRYNNFFPESDTIGSRKQIWFFAHPAYYIGKKRANFKIGVKTWFVTDKNDNPKPQLAPDVVVNLIPVKGIFRLYAGITGNYINNHYSKIAYENPFVDPRHNVRNSMEKIKFYGGFDVKLARTINFVIAADYAHIKDQPFYYLREYLYVDPMINPNPMIVDNDFKILYDDMKRLKINLELMHRTSDKFDLTLSGNYYAYTPDVQEEAWNLPDWDATLSATYKITAQLSIDADIFLIGTRKALIIEEPNPFLFLSAQKPEFKSYNLDTAFDFNARVNYTLTRKFSLFAQLNNFGFRKYERWFGYPVQSTNFLAGASYAF